MSSSDNDLHDEFYNTKVGYKDYQSNDDNDDKDYHLNEGDDISIVPNISPHLTQMMKKTEIKP